MTEFAIGFAESLGWFLVYIPFLVWKGAFSIKLD